jgi:transposase
LKPHKVQCWLNSRERNSETFDEEVKKVCDIYKNASSLKANGIHVECIDEKSGIQAIERPEPNKLMIPGHLEKCEHEYIRHGTQVLIASLEVATGTVSGELLDTRGNLDFLEYIVKRVATDPQAQWIFIADQLNTHKSTELVEWIAKECNIQEDLGVERKRGIIQSMESRAKFLTDKSHRIRFLYTPKHCSWLNQIEIWFSILSKRLLRRLSCLSLEMLKSKITSFISFFNETLARPFKWTYDGKGTSVLKK